MSGDGGYFGAYWSTVLRLVSHPFPLPLDLVRSCWIFHLKSHDSDDAKVVLPCVYLFCYVAFAKYVFGGCRKGIG